MKETVNSGLEDAAVAEIWYRYTPPRKGNAPPLLCLMPPSPECCVGKKKSVPSNPTTNPT